MKKNINNVYISLYNRNFLLFTVIFINNYNTILVLIGNFALPVLKALSA